MKLYDDLMYRGLIKDISSPDLEKKLNDGGLTFYIGTDPTAPSLHIGHLSSFLISKRLADAGHHPILLIGDATGLIGDPRPTSERDTIIKNDVFENAKSLKEQVTSLFGFKVNAEVYGFTMPLVTDKFGNKFGKSEGNALWLDKNKTSSYEIYQYLINADDSMVIDYLKIFTFLSKHEIEDYDIKTKEQPEKRLAQKALAYEVVKFLHGEDEAIKAKETSEKAFNNDFTNTDIPCINYNKKENCILDLLFDTNITSSKSEARRLILQGGISINNEKIDDVNYRVKIVDYIIIKKGKKNINKIMYNGDK